MDEQLDPEFARHYYTESQVAELLGIAAATMRRRIITRSNCPPYWSPRRGRYFFPKSELVDWCRSQGLTFEVKSVS